MSTDVTAPSSDTPTPLEALQQRHRKEQRDLVSRITQKKKQATKKTRKGVNDECERLERELQERQAEEVRTLNGDDQEHVAESEPEDDTASVVDINITELSINGPSTSTAPSTPPSTTASATAPKKKNRQKERLARRKAEQEDAIAAAEREALNAPSPRELERLRFEPLLAAHGLQLHEIRADGHCLYAAFADQLVERALGLTPQIPLPSAATDMPPYKTTRHAAAAWIENHADDFAPFMEDSVKEHVRKIRETGEWGGHLELLALARGYGVRICVLHSDGRVDRIGDEGEREEVWLGYYRHSHGLGEHYNSLRKAEATAVEESA